MMARTLSVVLACFASPGHGRRVQGTQSRGHFDAPDPLTRLASLILTSEQPEVGWQARGSASELTLRNLHSHRSAQPTMKKTRLKVSEDLIEQSRREQELKQQQREAKKQAKAAKLRQDLLSGVKRPETVEELFEVVKEQKGEQEAMKFIVDKAAHAAKKRVGYLPAGSLLPEPSSGFANLEFINNDGAYSYESSSYESLQEVADGKRTLVLVASSDPVLTNKLREVFSEINSVASQLDAAVIGVAGAGWTQMRKFSHKWGISFPLLSDPNDNWLAALKCETYSGQLMIHIVDVASQTLVTTFDGKGHFAPPMLAKIIAAAVQQRSQEKTHASTVHSTESKAQSSETVALPGLTEPRAENARYSSESEVAQSATVASPGLTELRAENMRLKAALQEAGILEKTTQMAAENEMLKAALMKSKASRAEHEAKRAEMEAKSLRNFDDMLEPEAA